MLYAVEPCSSRSIDVGTPRVVINNTRKEISGGEDASSRRVYSTLDLVSSNQVSIPLVCACAHGQMQLLFVVCCEGRNIWRVVKLRCHGNGRERSFEENAKTLTPARPGNTESFCGGYLDEWLWLRCETVYAL